MRSAPSNLTTAKKGTKVSAARREVTVKAQNGFAVFDRPVPELVEQLEYTERTFEPELDGGYREIVETYQLWMLDHKKRMGITVGMLTFARNFLEARGYTVTVKYLDEPAQGLRFDSSAAEPERRDEIALLEAVAREPMGQIEVGSDDDALRHCQLLCERCPATRFVLLCPTVKTARNLFDQLSQAIDERIGLATGKTSRRGDRILVGTAGKIPTARLKPTDVLLIPFAKQSLGNSALTQIVEWRLPRTYAWHVPSRSRERKIDLRVECVAGPVIVRLGRPRVPVDVVMVATPEVKVKVKPGTTELLRKRKLIWNNAARNNLIAEIARAVSTANRDKLERFGFGHAAMKSLQPLHDRRVAILVDGPEHGRRLRDLLPRWELYDMNPATASASSTNTPAAARVKTPPPAADAPAPRTTTPSSKAQRKTRIVVTAMYAAHHRISADVIIRATGTAWPLHLMKFPPRQDNSSPAKIVIVDFEDDSNRSTCSDRERRIADYERRGWRVMQTGVPEHETFVESNSSRPPGNRHSRGGDGYPPAQQ